MKCLILGGAGFIGSHVADCLIEAGHEVRIFDRPNIFLGNLKACKGHVEMMEGDFNNEEDLDAALSDMEVIINLVWTTLPGPSNENPEYDIETNVIGNIKLLTAARKHSIKKIIFASSGGTVYGIPKSIPIKETQSTAPLCSYGITKLAVEKYLALYNHLYGGKYIVLRISNPYGERQRSDSVQGVIAVFMDRILKGETLYVWGDGSVARDFVYVKDLASAVLNSIDPYGASGVYNIGGGSAATINEIISKISEIAGKTPRVKYSEKRKMDVPINYLCIEKAGKDLFWKPETSLDEGIRKMFEWMRAENHL